MPGFADVMSGLKAVPWRRVGGGALSGALYGGLAGGTVGEIAGIGAGDDQEDLARRTRRYMLYGALPGAVVGGLGGYGKAMGWGEPGGGAGARGGRSAGGGPSTYAPRGSMHPKDVDWLKGVKTKADAKARYRAASRKFHPDFAKDPVDRAAREEAMKKINHAWDSVQNHPAYTKMAFFCGMKEACERFGLDAVQLAVLTR